ASRDGDHRRRQFRASCVSSAAFMWFIGGVCQDTKKPPRLTHRRLRALSAPPPPARSFAPRAGSPTRVRSFLGSLVFVQQHRTWEGSENEAGQNTFPCGDVKPL